jgi:hypothetical protein
MNEKEVIFDRQENKFFVPAVQRNALRDGIDSFATNYNMEKSVFPYDTHRTMYFFPGNVNGLVPGFGVRYRDYAPGTYTRPGVTDGFHGAYELKCSDEERSGVKKKMKIPSPLLADLTVDQLQNLIKTADTDDDTKEWFLRKLSQQKLAESVHLFPLVAASYHRTRYRKGENVFSVDSDIDFYAVEHSGSNLSFIKTGSYDGLICELKEHDEDIPLRWQIYRRLVQHDAERFYGKKGHALNLLIPYVLQQKNPELVTNELPGEELEIKLNIAEPLAATQYLGVLYNAVENPQNSTGFYVSPPYPVFTSQTTINQYFVKPHQPEIEQKMVLRLGRYKYSRKDPSDNVGVVYSRHEDKGVVHDYTRASMRRDRADFQSVGKILRIKNAFWVYSPTGKVYKVSVDIDRKLPFVLEQVFCQLEVEYTGSTRNNPGNSSHVIRSIVLQELVDLKKHIERILVKNGVKFCDGERKVDILRKNPLQNPRY